VDNAVITAPKLSGTAPGAGARDNRYGLYEYPPDPPASLRFRAPFQAETALPEANSFLFECQPFGNIPAAYLTTRRSVPWRVLHELRSDVQGRQRGRV
jgi:hypothetical protein